MSYIDEFKERARECASTDECLFCSWFRDAWCDRKAFARNALKATQRLEAQMPKWISVKERLPGAKGPYLVCGEHWIAGTKTITTICFWWGDRWDRDKVFEITHWMPLPEPPKENNT